MVLGDFMSEPVCSGLEQRVDELSWFQTTKLPMLTPRHFDVLHAIVHNYIETGEPVASRTIARKYPMSPASIRNMMADLLERGLSCSSHIRPQDEYRPARRIAAT